MAITALRCTVAVRAQHGVVWGGFFVASILAVDLCRRRLDILDSETVTFWFGKIRQLSSVVSKINSNTVCSQ